MENSIFAFTLNTKENLGELGCIFDIQGNIIGRILKKRPVFKDSYDESNFNGSYSYDIESSKDTFKRIESGEIIISNEHYTVENCSTVWYNPKK